MGTGRYGGQLSTIFVKMALGISLKSMRKHVEEVFEELLEDLLFEDSPSISASFASSGGFRECGARGRNHKRGLCATIFLN